MFLKLKSVVKSSRRISESRFTSRRGTAIVEFAVISPIIVLLIFATIDICSFMYLKQSLKVASYEATRVAVIVGSTRSLAQGQAELLLNQRGVKGYSVTINPSPESLNRGDFVTVRVTAPGGPNLPMRGWFCGGLNTFGETSMMSDR